MNNQNRILLCSVLFTSLMNSTTLIADSDTSRQTLSITIPKVALIKLDQAEHTFIFSGNTQVLSHTSKVALSSNDRNLRINVSVNDLPENMNLKIAADSKICSDATTQSSRTFSCRVGIKAIRDGELVLTASRKNQQSIPNGRYAANIIYTLSD